MVEPKKGSVSETSLATEQTTRPKFEKVPSIQNVEKFIEYHEYLQRLVTGQLTSEEEKELAMSNFLVGIQQDIQKSGKSDEISAVIENNTLVIKNKNQETILIWDQSDPEMPVKLCKLIGTGN